MERKKDGITVTLTAESSPSSNVSTAKDSSVALSSITAKNSLGKVRRILCISLFILAGGSSIILFWLFSEKKPSSVLEQLSQQEREDLKNFCLHLIKETEFGYTLFGTKPVTSLSPDCPSKMMLNGNRALYYKIPAIIKKIIPKINIKKYTILFSDENGFISIYFINNAVFLKTFNENKSLFERFGCKETDPNVLLERLSKNEDFEEIVCNNHIALLGICLGYGTQNSLNAERKREIREYLFKQNMPPWNKSTIVLSDDIRKFLRLDQDHLDQWFPIKPCLPPKMMSPSVGFSSLEEEIKHLQVVLQDSTNQILDEISCVKIPLFWCDKSSYETMALLENYMRTRKILMEILVSEDIVQKIIDKLAEE
jgi:hypothetical protein